MFHKVECTSIFCDNCKEPHQNDTTEFSLFPLESDAEDSARDCDWQITEDHKHYCPACIIHSEDDPENEQTKITLDESRFKPE